jgi:ABC-type uncharacterized transport system substrate-binding protein
VKLVSTLFLTCTLSWGGDFDSVIHTLKKTWPDRNSIGVVCDSSASKAKIDQLAASCSGYRIIVIDVKAPQDVGKAIPQLISKVGVLLLMPGDRVAGDGQTGAAFLIQRLAVQHIPTIAVTEAGVKQGAVFAATGNKILVNPNSASVCGVSLPEGGIPIL